MLAVAIIRSRTIVHISDRHLPAARAVGYPRGRGAILQGTAFAGFGVPFGLDTQFQTPSWCAEYMVSLIPPNCRTVLEPTPGLGNLVRALRLGGYEVTAPVGDFWAEIDANRRFAVVMNTPFNEDGWEIVLRCMELSDHIIALQPWMVLINSERRTKFLFDFGLVSVTHLPRRTFPGARVQTCVFEMHRGYRGKTILRYTDRGLDRALDRRSRRKARTN